ncbi:hypothetical protein M422DRAFT_54310 [Sphaerobolus stellatus SS14]|uniref:Uncharacterized protein n=1 Tax=Sphaerobolus stellatus (strain SS14) TaxID=990650 RepID=A0A0C9UV50_SPHS4|nr:hypothetical protein M422DRAFT_54310 [Sphaerobolus stellatus SS14]
MIHESVNTLHFNPIQASQFGYGSGGQASRVYSLPPDQGVDIGFSKLFLLNDLTSLAKIVVPDKLKARHGGFRIRSKFLSFRRKDIFIDIFEPEKQTCTARLSMINEKLEGSSILYENNSQSPDRASGRSGVAEKVVEGMNDCWDTDLLISRYSRVWTLKWGGECCRGGSITPAQPFSLLSTGGYGGLKDTAQYATPNI